MNIAQLESKFGRMVQVAYVVSDLDTSIQSWHQQMGVGPFAVLRNVSPFNGATYRGKLIEDLRVDLAFAYMGDIQLELIEQLDDKPSIYKEMLDRGNPGLHHYCFAADNYAAAYAEAIASGFVPVVQVGNEDNGMLYCESSLIPGLILEIIAWDETSKPYFDDTRQYLSSVDQHQLIHTMEL